MHGRLKKLKKAHKLGEILNEIVNEPGLSKPTPPQTEHKVSISG